MKVDANIFREYDIRGIAGTKFSKKALKEYQKWYGKFPGITITPDIAEAIGKAYGTLIRERSGRKIIVGHEIRPYGEELKLQFIKGVRSTGCNVIDAGVSLTPFIYFATAYYHLDGGVNVTGSHNVYFFNGFKTMAKDVYPIYGKELKKMRKIIEQENFMTSKNGSYEKLNIFTEYQKYFLEHNHLNRSLKVVVDCGNGSAGLFAPEILRKLGCEVVELYTKPDSTFPNHVPDPEDIFVMRDLGKRVVKEKADLGIALDADGDRFGAVDEHGSFIYADRMLLLLAKDILSRNPGKKIVYDVKCTRLIDELVPKFGGIPVMHITGHAPIKQTLRNDPEVIFAGEVSGHFYFVEDYFKIDDGLYAAGKLLSILAQGNKPFSRLFESFPKTVMTPELKLPCSDSAKQKIVAQISTRFSKKYKTIAIDGIRILFSDTSWGLVRASNTSPYLTIRVEADTEKEVIDIKNLLADQLEKYPEIGDRLNRDAVTTHSGKLGWV
ncbi:phosphomannomutase/phosphoglucomutase [Candidatus Collierbacteria bacterium]|nr:phosphomannomutase/phosphoglucomutase [Candidatus Collierbacteria bacterium]